jgi:hypothetical protein
MKVIDYIFFGIFNTYYKDGNYKNDIPEYTAMMIFGAMFFLNILALLWFFSSGDGSPISKPIAFVIGGFCVLLSYLLFMYRKRYESIYNAFSSYNRRQRQLNKLVAWTYIALSFLAIFLPAFLKVLHR